MEPIHYLRALRRRWWVIVASVAVASVAAWVTTAAVDSPKVAAAPRTTFDATTTLFNAGAPTLGQAVSLPEPEALANLVALPDVASIAEHALRAQGLAGTAAAQVYAAIDPVTGRLDITGTAAEPRSAVAVSTAYSRALITYLGRIQQKKITLQQRQLRLQIQTMHERGTDADAILTLQSLISDLELDRTTPIPLVIFQPASAVRSATPDVVKKSNGIQVPKSLPLRVTLAALLGLLAGLALALVLERFDTRIRSPRAAEEAFGLPVLAEVPAISRGRRGTIVTAAYPSSRAADAFRLIGVGTSRWIVDLNAHGNGDGNGNGRGRASRAKTFLVTSPEARDGKTTVAANLAVALAQAGSRVVVVSCDLRRPAIHEAFGVDESPGLADLLERTNGHVDPASQPDLTTYLEPCSVVRVAVVPSGVASEHPGALLASGTMERTLERLKRITDVIVLDCAPLVVASEVVPLLTQADGVIIVARARKTRRGLAASTAALLERLGTTTAGVVLNDAREFSIPLAKRRMYRPTRKMRRAARRSGPAPVEEPSKLEPFTEAERPVEIPSAQEVPEQPRPRTLEPLQSLQDELVELRTQLEGLQLELPDIAVSGMDRSGSDPGDRE